MSGLKRDPTVILRIDGEDLEEFINGPTFEPEMASIFSQMELSSSITLHDSILRALHKLGVEHGLPPPSDPWVMSNVLEPALEAHNPVTGTRESISQEAFLTEFKRVAEKVREHLKEQPVIVAHTESVFDGSAIKRLLANKFELEKVLHCTLSYSRIAMGLDGKRVGQVVFGSIGSGKLTQYRSNRAIKNALETLTRDTQGKISKDNLPTALASLSSPAGLPPQGTFEKVDKVTCNVLKTKTEDGKAVKEEEFKKILEEILGSMAAELECNPVSVSSSSVAHDTIASAASST